MIGSPADPYLHRWHMHMRVGVRGRDMRVYLHRFLRSDDARALHDHPWDNQSLVLTAPGYFEILADGTRVHRRPGDIVKRRAADPHRIELLTDDDGRPVPVWSLFTTGPWLRHWGFHCPNGWRHWKLYTRPIEGGNETGRGCA